jgi:hypothetical protein
MTQQQMQEVLAKIQPSLDRLKELSQQALQDNQD